MQTYPQRRSPRKPYLQTMNTNLFFDPIHMPCQQTAMLPHSFYEHNSSLQSDQVVACIVVAMVCSKMHRAKHEMHAYFIPTSRHKDGANFRAPNTIWRKQTRSRTPWYHPVLFCLSVCPALDA